MFIPLHDANALKHIRLQYVTLALIAINVAITLLTVSLPEQAAFGAAVGFGYIPSVYFDQTFLDPSILAVPDEMTLFTYAFLHGDLLHLGGNMIFLWVFGDNVEDALGHFRFMLFYMLCAAAGALAHGLVDPGSQVPLIGASGAVAGIVGAYLMLHPKVKIWVLALMRIPIRLPAMVVLGFWIAFQVFMFVAMPDDQVSWAAHVGGALAGMVLVIVLRRRGVPLFDRTIVRPDAAVVAESAASAPFENPGPTVPTTQRSSTPSSTPWGRAGSRRD